MNTIFIFNLLLERENGNILTDTKCFWEPVPAGAYYQKLRNQYNLKFKLNMEPGRYIYDFILN